MSAYRRYDENMTRILVAADCPRRRVENIHGGGIVRKILTGRWILYTRPNLSLYLLIKLRIFMIISLSVLRNIHTQYYIKKKIKRLIDVLQLNAPKKIWKIKKKDKQLQTMSNAQQIAQRPEGIKANKMLPKEAGSSWSNPKVVSCLCRFECK